MVVDKKEVEARHATVAKKGIETWSEKEDEAGSIAVAKKAVYAINKMVAFSMGGRHGFLRVR